MRFGLVILCLAFASSVALAQEETGEPSEGPPPAADAVTSETPEEEVWPEIVDGPRPEALIDLAAARESEGDGGLAIEALERFLETFPFDPRVAEITARLGALRKAKTRVTIESPHVAASVWMGGSKIAARTPAEIELPAGRHRIVVTARDGRSKVFDLVLPPASRRNLEVTFPGDFDPVERARFGAGEPLAAKMPEAEEPPTVAALEARRARRRVVALAGTSSATVVLTAVFGMMALSDAEEFRREPSEDVARSGERAAILADVSLGVALATGITALVLELRGRGEKKPSGVALAPALGRTGAGLVLRGGL